MSTRLRLSCRALLIIVLVRPNFYSALRLAIVQFSSPFMLTEFIWHPGHGTSTGSSWAPNLPPAKSTAQGTGCSTQTYLPVDRQLRVAR